MVLIIDDCADVGKAVLLSLELEGIACRCVTSAQEALRELARKRPMVIVLDDYMPGMDGIEFLTHLRADPKYAAIAVIFHTGGAGSERRAEAEKLGIAAWLVKSKCDWSEMLTHIRTQLDAPTGQQTPNA